MIEYIKNKMGIGGSSLPTAICEDAALEFIGFGIHGNSGHECDIPYDECRKMGPVIYDTKGEELKRLLKIHQHETGRVFHKAMDTREETQNAYVSLGGKVGPGPVITAMAEFNWSKILGEGHLRTEVKLWFQVATIGPEKQCRLDHFVVSSLQKHLDQKGTSSDLQPLLQLIGNRVISEVSLGGILTLVFDRVQDAEEASPHMAVGTTIDASGCSARLSAGGQLKHGKHSFTWSYNYYGGSAPFQKSSRSGIKDLKAVEKAMQDWQRSVKKQPVVIQVRHVQLLHMCYVDNILLMPVCHELDKMTPEIVRELEELKKEVRLIKKQRQVEGSAPEWDEQRLERARDLLEKMMKLDVADKELDSITEFYKAQQFEMQVRDAIRPDSDSDLEKLQELRTAVRLHKLVQESDSIMRLLDGRLRQLDIVEKKVKGALQKHEESKVQPAEEARAMLEMLSAWDLVKQERVERCGVAKELRMAITAGLDGFERCEDLKSIKQALALVDSTLGVAAENAADELHRKLDVLNQLQQSEGLSDLDLENVLGKAKMFHISDDHKYVQRAQGVKVARQTAKETQAEIVILKKELEEANETQSKLQDEKSKLEDDLSQAQINFYEEEEKNKKLNDMVESLMSEKKNLLAAKHGFAKTFSGDDEKISAGSPSSPFKRTTFLAEKACKDDDPQPGGLTRAVSIGTSKPSYGVRDAESEFLNAVAKEPGWRKLLPGVCDICTNNRKRVKKHWALWQMLQSATEHLFSGDSGTSQVTPLAPPVPPNATRTMSSDYSSAEREFLVQIRNGLAAARDLMMSGDMSVDQLAEILMPAEAAEIASLPYATVKARCHKNNPIVTLAQACGVPLGAARATDKEDEVEYEIVIPEGKSAQGMLFHLQREMHLSSQVGQSEDHSSLHLQVAWPLKRVSEAIKQDFGYDIPSNGLQLKAIVECVDSCAKTYNAVRHRLEQADPEQMSLLREIPSMTMCQAKQELETLEDILTQAESAQRILKEFIAPQTKWANTDMNNSQDIPLDDDQRTVHGPVQGGLVQGGCAFDPGIKDMDSIIQDANSCKRFCWHPHDLVDICHLDLTFDTVEALQKTYRSISDRFKVVWVNNKFQNPSPLGYSGISVGVEVPVPDGPHIGEVHLSLKAMANIRQKEEHEYYESIKEIIGGWQEVKVQLQHVEILLQLVLKVFDSTSGSRAREAEEVRQQAALMNGFSRTEAAFQAKVQSLKQRVEARGLAGSKEYADLIHSLKGSTELGQLSLLNRQESGSATALREAGLSAQDLKEAGYSATDLMSKGYTVAELREAEYTAVELRDAGCKAKELKEALYNAADLWEARYPPLELKEAGFSAAELEAAGYTNTQLKEAFNPEELTELSRLPAVRVAVRIRVKLAGYDSNERGPQADYNIDKVSGGILENFIILPPDYGPATEKRRWPFHRVFNDRDDQETIFKEQITPVLDRVLDRYPACFISYGQSGSGKTYTMLGGGDERAATEGFDKGVIPRSFEYLYGKLQNRDTIRLCILEFVAWRDRGGKVHQARDLLSLLACKNRDSGQLHINIKVSKTSEKAQQIDPVKNLSNVSGITIREFCKVLTGDKSERERQAQLFKTEIMQTVQAAVRNRKVLTTELNQESSRGHLVIMMEVHGTLLYFLDLAGSEKLKQSGVQEKSGNQGEGYTQAKEINQSLFYLRQMVSDVAKGRKSNWDKSHPVTLLLTPFIGGNGYLRLICTLRPGREYLSETKDTLRFATEAMVIKNQAAQNERMTLDEVLKELAERELEVFDLKVALRGKNEEIEDLKGELKDKVAQKDKEIAELKDAAERGLQTSAVPNRAAVETLRKALGDYEKLIEEEEKNTEGSFWRKGYHGGVGTRRVGSKDKNHKEKKTELFSSIIPGTIPEGLYKNVEENKEKLDTTIKKVSEMGDGNGASMKSIQSQMNASLTVTMDIICDEAQDARLKVPVRNVQAVKPESFSMSRSRTMEDLSAEEDIDAVTDEFELRPSSIKFPEPVQVYLPLRVDVHGCSEHDCDGIVVLKREEDGSVHEIHDVHRVLPSCGSCYSDNSSASTCKGLQFTVDSFCFVWGQCCKVGCSLEVVRCFGTSELALRATVDTKLAKTRPIGRFLKHSKEYDLVVIPRDDHDRKVTNGFIWSHGFHQSFGRGQQVIPTTIKLDGERSHITLQVLVLARYEAVPEEENIRGALTQTIEFSIGEETGNVALQHQSIDTNIACDSHGTISSKISAAIDEAKRKVPETPTKYIKPNDLKRLEPLLPLLNDSEELLSTGTDSTSPLCKLLEFSMGILEEYVEYGLKHWDLEETKAQGKKPAMEGSTEVYGGILKMVKDKDEFFSKIGPQLEKKQALVKRNVEDKIHQIPNKFERLATYWSMCSKMKRRRFDKLMHKVATKTGGKPKLAKLKGFPRALEKVLLRGIDEGLPWDVVRCMIECTTVQQVLEVVEEIMKEPGVTVRGLNDRFTAPKAGWADISIYIQFDDEELSSAIGEIQVVLADLVLARENLHAHDAYDSTRFASELLVYASNKFGKEPIKTEGLPYCRDHSIAQANSSNELS